MQALICPQCSAPLQTQTPNCPYCGVGLIHGTQQPSGQQTQQQPPTQPPPPPNIPPGWVQHRNEWYGFTIAHPPGWQVISVQGRFSVREDTVGMVSTLIWPLMLPEGALIGSPEIAAQQVAQYYISQIRAADPTIQAWILQADQSRPAVATVRTQRTYLNQPLEGIFSVILSGRNAILSGYECPPGQAASRAQVMGQILSSFRTIPAIPHQKVWEPYERAFEVEIPQGWLYQAMINRNNPAGMGLPQLIAGREQQNLVCVSIPSMSWTFVENAWNNPFGGYQVMPYVPAHVLCQQWLVPYMRQQYRDLTVVDITDRPDYTYLAYADAAASGQAGTMHITSALMTVIYTENGVSFKQRALIMNNKPLTPYGSGGLWMAFLNVYYRAPENEFDHWAPILEGIANSYKLNPAWQQQQQGMVDAYTIRSQADISRRLGQISQTLSETSDIVSNSYWQRQETYDRLGQMWSNTILGRQDMATSTGEVYNVPAGYDRYWVDNANTIYAGSWSSTPDSNWTPLEPTGT